MKSLFQNKISVNKIKEFEKLVVEKLKFFNPNFEDYFLNKFTEIDKIYFAKNGISISRIILDNQKYQQIKKENNFILNFYGIKFLNKKTKNYDQIPLSFSNYQLNFIEVQNAATFHKNYDFESIKIDNIDCKKVALSNPDKIIAEKILNLTEEEKSKLDLDSCFEIEFENNFYYTVLDFEDGNYLAVDKNSNVYLLNHNADQQIKKVDNDAKSFFVNYDGNRSKLLNQLE